MKNITVLLIVVWSCFCLTTSANEIKKPSEVIPLTLQQKFQKIIVVALSGDKEAQFIVAKIYLKGYKEINKDLDNGFRWLEMAAEDSNPKQQRKIAGIYHYGDYADRDFERAFHWYLIAANGGDSDAMNSVGLFYSGGLGGAKQSCEKAISWYKKSMRKDPEYSGGNLVWILATCADEKWRNGKLALKMAKEILANAEIKIARDIDNLAAAYAELNMFDLAIKTQQQAIELIDPEKEAKRLENFNKRLNLYKGGEKWRGASNESPDDFDQE